MKRAAHYLKRSATARFPGCVLGVAVEGKLGSGGVWCAQGYYPEGQDSDQVDRAWGKTQAEFWSYLRGHLKYHKGAWVVFCGAVQQLTALGFWDQLEEGYWELSDHEGTAEDGESGPGKTAWAGTCVLSDPPTIVVGRCVAAAATAKFLDVRNYGVSGGGSLDTGGVFPVSVLGKSQAAAHGIVTFMRTMADTLRSHKLGGLKTTAGSQAMHSYRHRFLNGMVLSHANYPALGLERQALFAGRNECWVLGSVPGPVYHLDFNAFYPSVAASVQLPARLKGYSLGCRPDPLVLMKAGWCVIAEVTLETNSADYPVRFSRARHNPCDSQGLAIKSGILARDGDLLFPVGRFATALCGPELQVAYDRGCVKRIHSVAWYEPHEMFTGWHQETQKITQELRNLPQKAPLEWIKRVRNSVFGKFGQWGWSWLPAPWMGTKYPFDTWYGPGQNEGGLTHYRSIGWSVQYERRSGESPESCPAVSAWVYSLARVVLLAGAAAAGRENVHYMDADSVWCNHEGYIRLRRKGWLSQDQPGMLKLCGIHERVTFHGLKAYTTDKGSVVAGVPVSNSDPVGDGWRFRSHETVNQALAHNRAPEERKVTYTVQRRAPYRHGIVCNNGRVMPYTLWED